MHEEIVLKVVSRGGSLIEVVFPNAPAHSYSLIMAGRSLPRRNHPPDRGTLF
jgi:hypothetical protein